MFESNSPVMTSRQIPVKPPIKPSYLRTANQNGNVPTLPGKTEKSPVEIDVNSNSVPNKPLNRRSQVNIPAAFLQKEEDSAMKPKPDETPPKPPVKPGVNKPPWVKPETTQKPDPPWKPKPAVNSESDKPQNGTASDKPIPPWKQAIMDKQKAKEEAEKAKSDTDTITEKPIPPWKARLNAQQNKPTPPPPTAKPKSDLPTPPPSTAKPKPDLPSPNSPKPLGVNVSELGKMLGNLKHSTPNSSDASVPLRSDSKPSAIKRQASRKSLTRTLDNKKFILVEADDIDVDLNSIPPPKPARLVTFSELERIIADYKAQVAELG